jgi:hypothetical protein
MLDKVKPQNRDQNRAGTTNNKITNGKVLFSRLLVPNLRPCPAIVASMGHK